MDYNYQRYAVNVERDIDGGYVITSVDVPGVITQCDDAADIVTVARDAHLTMFNYMIKDREAIPASTASDEAFYVDFSTEQAMKIAAYNALLRKGETFLGLAKKMQKDPKEIRRAFNLRTSTKTDMLEKMLGILGGGQRIVFTLP